MIQVVLLNLIQADILMTDKWLQDFLEKLGMDRPVSPIKNGDSQQYNYFQDSGYEVDYLLGNLGSTFVYLILLPSFYLLLGVSYLFGLKFKKFK